MGIVSDPGAPGMTRSLMLMVQVMVAVTVPV